MHERAKGGQFTDQAPKHAQNSPKTHENGTPRTKAKQQQQNTHQTPKQPSPQAERQSTQTVGQGSGQVVDFAR
jgi:hypothetical protein